MADPSSNSWASSWHPFGGALDPNFYGWGDQALGRAAPAVSGAATGPVYHSAPAAPAGDWGATDWYNTPGVTFNAQGQAWNPATSTYHNVQWPAFMGTDPQLRQAAYGLYQQASPADRLSMLLTQGDAQAQRDRALANQAAGREWLGGQMTDVRNAGQAWATDPYRTQVMAELARRASPGYSFFTPRERTAAMLPVGQQYATDAMIMAADAANRGGGGGGLDVQNNAILRGQAETRGAMVGASMDAAEQQLHQAALDSLARTGGAYNAADVQYLQASNQLAGALASLETGTEFKPADYTVWPALTAAEDRAKQEADFRQQAMDAAIKQAQYNVPDLLASLLSAGGSGPMGYLATGALGLAGLGQAA